MGVAEAETEAADAQQRVSDPLPGWRRYRCGGCRYQYETLGASCSAPDLCGVCGRPWVAVTEVVG